MKKLAVGLASILLLSRASAVFPFYEPFADATGSGGTAFANNSLLAGQTNASGDRWYGAGTTQTGAAATMTNFSLSYPGLPASAGNSYHLRNGSGPGGRMFAQNFITNQDVTLYYSLILKAENIAALSATGDYFIGFNNQSVIADQGGQPGIQGARLVLKKNGTGYQLGIAKNGPTTGNFDGAVHNTNEVLFIVASYEMISAGGVGTDDNVHLWVNPDTNTFGKPVPPAETTNMIGTDNDITFISTFVLLDRTATVPTSTIVDEVRLGRTWTFVTGGPEITVPPTNQSVPYSSNFSLTVSARSGSSGALGYRWQKDGSDVTGGNVSGATSPTLTVSSVTASDGGIYSIIVTNGSGSATNSVTITIQDPYVTVQPADQVVGPLGTAHFSITAVGTPALSYRWQKDGSLLSDDVNITGSGTASLTVANVSGPDLGSYSCFVTNGPGAFVVSSNASLSLQDPGITPQPQSVDTNYGATVRFASGVVGTGPFTFVWQKDSVTLTDGGSGSGATISGAGTSNLTIAGVGCLDAGVYSLIVTGNQGTAFSSNAALTVADPYISVQPLSRIDPAGSTSTFSVTASGSGTLTYQWQKGNTALTDAGNVSGSSSATLTLTTVSNADQANYSVIVTGNCGSNAVSAAATLTVLSPPAITSPPQSRTVRVGDHIAFVVSATGTAPLNYQWSYNNTPLSGATGTSYPLSSVDPTNAGTYTITVANNYGTNTASASLIVSNGLLHLSPTNLVIVRVGDGVETLSTSGNTVYLDQYTTGGVYVSTIMIPDSGSSSLIVSGSGNPGSTESVLTRSAGKRFVNFGGYNVTYPYAGAMSGDNASLAPRGFGAVNGLGYFVMVWADFNLYNSATFRSITSTDGLTNFWTGGSSRGVKYVKSHVSPDIQISASNADPGGSGANVRVANIFNGNLYISCASGTHGLWVFNGIPTTATTPTFLLSPDTANSETFDYAVSPDGNTIYLGDDSSVSIGGGIQRFDFNTNSSTWNNTYTFPPSATGSGVRCLEVDFGGFTGGGASATGAVIYATAAEGTGNRFLRVVDNGASSPVTVLTTSGPNQFFRGIRFGPIADPPSIAVQPQSQTAEVGANVTFNVTPAGSAPFTYQWRYNGGPLLGATNSFLSFNVRLTDAGPYSVDIANDLSSVTSSNAVLTVAIPPPILQIGITSGTVTLTWTNAVSGVTYRAQYNTNLSTTNWTSLVPDVTASSNIATKTDNPGSGAQRFYRVIVP